MVSLELARVLLFPCKRMHILPSHLAIIFIQSNLNHHFFLYVQGKCGTSRTQSSWEPESGPNICRLHDILLHLRYVLFPYHD